jgi:predicted nuclease of predicted toxin-antitoxin system
MKLLFDENLSHKLVRRLADLFPDSIHVRDVGLKAADMHQRSFVFGHPPKIIWVRLGNCSTADVEKLLRKNFSAVKTFHEDDYASFLSLS